MAILIPLLCALVGCLTYALATNAKVAELGRLLFFTGVLVTLLYFQGHVFHLS